MKRKMRLVYMVLLAVLCLSGCGKNKSADKDAIVPVEEVTKMPEVASPSPAAKVDKHKGQVKSWLTGEWINKKLADKRPYAIMINNIKAASPQCGTSQASIMYEAVVEGGITRMMGIFQDFDSKRIGSTRSARHYFVSFADEYDAIYVHYGQTKYATAKIEELGVNNLSGLSSLGDTVFYRDPNIKAPHNAFTSTKGVKDGTKAAGYRTKLRENVNKFQFHTRDTGIEGTSAKKVTLGYSSYTQPYFTYNKKSKKYERYQFGEKHIDKSTGKQLAFKNIIIQVVDEWDIDKNGYQTMDINNTTGEGYYITNGKAAKITWKKNENSKKRVYYDEDGKELKLNTGKTFISIYPKKSLNTLLIA